MAVYGRRQNYIPAHQKPLVTKRFVAPLLIASRFVALQRNGNVWLPIPASKKPPVVERFIAPLTAVSQFIILRWDGNVYLPIRRGSSPPRNFPTVIRFGREQTLERQPRFVWLPKPLRQPTVDYVSKRALLISSVYGNWQPVTTQPHLRLRRPSYDITRFLTLYVRSKTLQPNTRLNTLKLHERTDTLTIEDYDE